MSILDLASGAAVLQFWMEKDSTSDVEGELDETLDQLLQELEGKIEDKVEAYCRIIRELELTQAARKEESDRIRKLADQDGNTVKAMKGRLMFFFGLQKINKLKTNNFNLSICANGGNQPIEVNILPELLLSSLSPRQRACSCCVERLPQIAVESPEKPQGQLCLGADENIRMRMQSQVL